MELVQLRAAQWVCGSRWMPTINKWSKSSAECFTELAWPDLSTCYNYLSLSLLNVSSITIGHYPYQSLFVTYTVLKATHCMIPLPSTINWYIFKFLWILFFFGIVSHIPFCLYLMFQCFTELFTITSAINIPFINCCVQIFVVIAAIVGCISVFVIWEAPLCRPGEILSLTNQIIIMNHDSGFIA